MAAYSNLSSILLSLDAILDHNRDQLQSLRDKVKLLLQRLQMCSVGEHVVERLDIFRDVSSQAGDHLALLARKRAELKVGDETEGQVLSRILKEMDAMAHVVNEIEVSSAASSLSRQHQNAVVGMDKDLEKMKTKLGYSSSNLEIVSVTGMGGIGKTTLARSVYDDSYINYHFDIRAWATVSQEHQLRRVLLDLFESAKLLKKETQRKSDDRDLGDYLYKALKGRRYLIVMDDVWDIDIWYAVRRYFPDDNNGSRVLLTTRLTEVARAANSSSPPHQMHLLNQQESWKLFCDQALVGEDCPAELKELGDEIVQNCKGLPLAIAVIGGLLSKIARTQEAWRRFADTLSLAAAKDSDERMEILTLSYNHLPQHLKPCFLYTGMFPEDYAIPVTKLSWLWAAEGFLPLDSSKSPEELAEDYLQDLVERNLVLVHSLSSQGKIKTCMVHDVLRDLCLYQAQKEKFLYVAKHYVDVLKVGREGCRRLSIHPSLLEAHPDILYDEQLCNSSTQSLLYVGTKRTYMELKNLGYRLLRVLDMLSIEFAYFPLEAADLVNLSYLAVCYGGTLHPYISKLQNLQTLIFQDNLYLSVQVLPVEIWMMPKLRHLIVISGHLPHPLSGSSAFSLGSLQTLANVVNLTFGDDQILHRIASLKKLSISYQVDWKSFRGWSDHRLENLVHLDQLEKLTLRVHSTRSRFSSYPSNLALPLSLKNLTLRSCRIPWAHMTLVGALPNLEVLRLKRNACKGAEWEPVEGQFLKLKSLLLKRASDLVQWTADETHFPCLRRLVVYSCPGLKEIPPGIADIPTLERIELVDCHPPVVASAERIREDQCDNMGDSDAVNLHVYYTDEFQERMRR